jgi:alpha-amylase
MKKRLLLFITCAMVLQVSSFSQTTKVKKVVFQGFWWDYWNNNFPNAWANYLTELAPRLKSLGVDAVWIPPSVKNQSTGYVGYSPFDHYDLGDKYQKGGGSLSTRTRLGTKDELLRLIAVLHANGIEVIQDVVLNHTNNAGTNGGTGGQDPQMPFSMANEGGFKNFRYVSYSTPLINESSQDYWTRNGRWPKNYPNFYPNLNNNCTTGDICTNFFGPDMSYEASAFGRSSNIPTSGSVSVGGVGRSYVNPLQSSDYMRNNTRNWFIWHKKQTGVDGFRWDAVKHFPVSIQQDLTFNVKYNMPVWAQGGETMFNVGEWIGSKGDIDNYVNAIKSGTEEHTGTFDFSLRGYSNSGGIYSMVLSGGSYNMQNLPGEQQDKRFMDYATRRVHRTVPFVNSHDTYRPNLDPSGNFLKPLGDASGWNTGSELGGNGQHIDPREPRLYAAYAVAFAVDGNPCVFFEDLFDVGTTGKRFGHQPTSTVDLPVREDLANIMRAHGKLAFKDGNYAVPTAVSGANAPVFSKGSSGDHIVFERIGKALIGVTDKFAAVSDNSVDEEVWVSVGDMSWAGKQLIDFSGAHGLNTTQVFPDGRVLIKTAPVGHTIPGAHGHGYSIWAPVPDGVTFNTLNDLQRYLMTYSPSRVTSTVQEWEMANDLGDSHVNSLRQGGSLPANSTAERIAGRIYAMAGTTVRVLVYPEFNGRSQTAMIYNTSNSIVSQITGSSSNSAPLTLNFTPSSTGWYSIRVRNGASNTSAMRVWVNVTYTAPPMVDTRNSPGNLREAVIALDEESATFTANKESFATVYPNPAQAEVNFEFSGVPAEEVIEFRLVDLQGREIFRQESEQAFITRNFNEGFSQLRKGAYVLSLRSASLNQQIRLLKAD